MPSPMHSKVSRKIDRIVKDFREGMLLAKPIAAGEVELKMKEELE